jgi:hypothetical protein
MRILYKLVSSITAKVGARLGKSVFRGLWSRIDTAEPPAATTAEASLPKVVGAAALEAATMASVAAAVNRVTANVFRHLFGVWPGEKGSGGEKGSSGEQRSSGEKRSQSGKRGRRGRRDKRD